MLPSAVSEHYRAQQRLIVSTLALTRREWSTMDPVDLEASWAKVGPRVNLLTTAGQLGAARNGAGYVAATLLGDYGEDVVSRGVVNPRAFAGIASDGRPLDTLLDGALYRAKGMNLESGGKWLDMAVHTQIADAGRASAATAIASYDDVGWVRMVNPPCCGPCAVLSGKKFRYNQGFERHPRCDCVHIPSTLRNPADNMGVNPSLDQITDLTNAERKALEEGADLPQVINARRSRSRDKMSTTEGTARDRSRRRLTPDGIFAQAKSRDEALALLRQNGYLSEYGRAVRLQPWSTPTASPPRPRRPLRRFNPDEPTAGFDSAEADAIRKYQTNWYHDINDPLRDGTALGVEEQKVADLLDDVIGSSALPEETVVYRGLYDRPPGLESGVEFLDRAYVSTSLNEDFVRRIFTDGADSFVMKIRLPQGTNAIRLDTPKSMPDYFQEDEILLGRDTRFRVLSETKEPGMPTVFEMEVIP